MGFYRFEALDENGKKMVDTVEAGNREEALLALRSRGLTLIRWGSSELSLLNLLKGSGKKLNTSRLLQFTEDLSHLLNSGLPIDRALTTVESSSVDPRVRDTALHLKKEIKKGSSLSEAMETRPADFNSLYINMVRAGELGGVLGKVMEKLSELLETTEEVKRHIISSSIYPAILLLVGFASILVILGFVVPSFAGVFNDLGQELPLSTQILQSLSLFLRKWWWLMIIILLFTGVLAWRILKTRAGKRAVDRYLIRFPYIGTLLLDIQISRFVRTLGTLVQSGVPMLKALYIVRQIAGNLLLKEALEEIYTQVKQGGSLSSLMKKNEIFPSVVIQMTSIGEETGDLGKMLVLCADDFEKKIRNRIKTYLAMVEPLSILVMGLIIGGIVVSMLSTVFGVNAIAF